jgi:hypothetical protein
MDGRQGIGLAGALVLLVGAFCPILSAPIMGSINYFQNGRGDGVVVVALAVVSLLAVLGRKYPWLWLTGGASLVLVLYTMNRLMNMVNQIQADATKGLEGNPFAGLASLVTQSVQLQWGWAILFAGCALLLICAGVKSPLRPGRGLPKGNEAAGPVSAGAGHES